MSSQSSRPQRRRSSSHDPYTAAHIYYSDEEATKRELQFRGRTASNVRNFPSHVPARADGEGQVFGTLDREFLREEPGQHRTRRSSHDALSSRPRRFLVPVETTLKALLAREDTDKNMQITIEDSGPKASILVLSLGTAASNGFNKFDIRGTYMLSNLLQELTLAKGYGREQIVLDEDRLNENPVNRLSRLIRSSFWDALTRRIDGSLVEKWGKDPKDWTDYPRPRIYIPHRAPEQYEYYSRVAAARPELHLEVLWLPDEPITGEFVKNINNKPGLLALAMEKCVNEETREEDLRGLPFVVPGGRFNELYGWDSYMVALGLLVNDRVDLTKSMVLNFCFCIEHYGKILNANRSYYLSRSQPPFLTDMALKVFERIKHEPGAIEFLRKAILSAIKEYYSIWMTSPRLDPATGLSRYRPDGVGVPPETEASHFVHILEPYAKKHGLPFKDFVEAYNDGFVKEPELDEYFLHDRAVRESGHDTSYRLEKVAANLATIDLNSLLYRYEIDIARTIRNFFGDSLSIPDEFRTQQTPKDGFETSASWDRRAKRRKLVMDKYMWDENKGMYFDYDTVKKVRTSYETATTFWSMWAGLATPPQAASLMTKALPLFEAYGGLVSGTRKSRGEIGLDRPNRQWDFPFGWAPQQMLAWTGFIRYGYQDEAERLAYKWLYMVTKAFVDFNGVVVEKYDVTRPIDPHRVDAEYGNQGADFKGVAREGFGWVNASYVYGLQIVNAHMKRALGAVTPFETYQRATIVDIEALKLE